MENDRIRQQEATDWTMEQTVRDFAEADKVAAERARERYEGNDWDTDMAWLYE